MTHPCSVFGPLKTALFSIAITLSMSLFAAFPESWAASSFKVGLIDPQAVIEQSRAGKRALDTLKEHFTLRQKLLASDEEELKGLEQELRTATNLSDADKQSKQEIFRKKYQEYQKRGAEFQQELAQKQKELVLEYMKKIETATEAVAERQGFSLVIDKGNESTLKIVLYNQKGLDITDEVVKEFDRRYK